MIHVLRNIRFASLVCLIVILAAVALPQIMLASAATDSFALSTEIWGNGTVQIAPAQASYSAGQQVTMTAVPASGWRFSHWEGDVQSTTGWWDTGWDYRVLISVNSGSHTRLDKPVEVNLNFTQLLAEAGGNGEFDPGSMRIIEKNTLDAVVATDVPLQFDPANDYDAVANASGTLIFMLSGTTAVQSIRYFELYFDVAAKLLPGQSVPAQVRLTDNVTDEGQASYRIETAAGVYFYHKEGAGFSSLNDIEGYDWIGYNTAAGNAGAFRGIPDLVRPADGGYFHPGVVGLTSSVVRQGPLRITIESRTVDDLWKVRWEIYPTYATLTTLKVKSVYWFLYEGTPGGALDSNDFVVRSDGTQSDFDDAWCNDTSSYVILPTTCAFPGPDWSQEWLYVSDPSRGTSGRSIYFAHHENDAVLDSYRRASGAGAMTILGFGRFDNSPLLTATGQQVTFGLTEGTDFAGVKKVVRSAYEPLTIGVQPASRRNSAGAQNEDNPLILTMSTDRSVTAVFTENHYSLSLRTVGNGVATATEPHTSQGYLYGDSVQLNATPASGWLFDSWSGDYDGNTASTHLTIDASKSITATFFQALYAIVANAIDESGTPVDDGHVAISPPEQSAGYVYGENVTLQAFSTNGWEFVHWDDALTGTASTMSLTVSGDTEVTAVFRPVGISVSTRVVDEDGAAIEAAVTLSPSPSPDGYHYGDMLTITAPTLAGRTFLGWEGSILSANMTEVITLQTSISVRAVYQTNFYRVAGNVVDEQGSTSNRGRLTISAPADRRGYTYGERASLTIVTDAGWRLDHWSGDLTGKEPGETISITGDVQVSAHIAPIRYTITVHSVDGSGDVTGGGMIQLSPPSESAGYVFGETVSFSAIPANGWLFDGWSGALTTTSGTAMLVIDGDILVRAHFSPMIYGVDLLVAGSGRIEALPQLDRYPYNSVVRLTAISNSGWNFAGWEGGEAGEINQDGTMSLVVRRARMVTARFVPGGTEPWRVYLPSIVTRQN